MKMRTGIRAHAGFTLLELLVAVTIVAIVSAIGIPSLSALKASYDLSTATNQLAFEIVRTRMQAVGQNKFMRIRRVDDTIYARETSNDGTSYTQEQATTLPSSVSLTVGETGNPTFNRSGLANATATYTLTRQVGNRTYTKTITVSALGRVKVS